jgi:hypothetical protein
MLFLFCQRLLQGVTQTPMERTLSRALANADFPEATAIWDEWN